MQRVRVSLPHFVATGWDVTVLTVDDPTSTAPLEPGLLATVPDAVRVVRARCFSRRWTGLLGVNNVALRSLPFLFLAGCRLLGARRHDVVYFSTTMFSVLPLGRLWKMLAGTPYVIDLQDPWVTDYYDRAGSPPPPGGWKYRVMQAIGRTLEGWTLRGASQLIVVSAAYATAVRARHPALHALPATELPFGSPDPDLARVRAQLASSAPLLPPGGLRLVFAGALGPGMLAAVDVLFAGMAEARRGGLDVSARFYGTSYAPGAGSRPATLALAARYGLSDSVAEQPARLRYFDALRVTLEADVNLLLGSTDLAFTPSKILAVLAAGRPVLAIAPAGGAMDARLKQLGQDCVTFPAGGPLQPASAAIAARLSGLAAGHGRLPSAAALAPFSARAIAERQLAILAAAT